MESWLELESGKILAQYLPLLGEDREEELTAVRRVTQISHTWPARLSTGGLQEPCRYEAHKGTNCGG